MQAARGLTINASAYSLLDRCLHWLALQPTAVRHLSFELERIFALPPRSANAPVADGNWRASGGAVYVCGLARSGTTMMLQLLDQAGTFRSLTYRDMPFVLAPSLWRSLSRYAPRTAARVERVHGDGVMVDVDSPEAFEEVFWRTFDAAQVREGGSCYGAQTPSAEVLAAFADYRALVANPKSEPVLPGAGLRRYLSKNNNNLLRLASLAADVSATVLLVYRDPVATARSLHRLHLRFSAESNQRFTRAYMAWLGHHEFGPGHQPFCFALPFMNPLLRPQEPDYWLDYWNAVYRYVLAQRDLRVTLVNHDDMCRRPQDMLDAIFSALGVTADTIAMAGQVRRPAGAIKPPDEFDEGLLAAANATHSQLVTSPANVLYSAELCPMPKPGGPA